jgi:serine/threonine protein kinase
MFGAVSRVTHKGTGESFAMKHIDLQALKGEQLLNLYLSLREIEMMKRLDHPHIIKIYEIFRGPQELRLVMEFCSGGELQEKLEAMPPLPCPEPFPEHVPRFPPAEARKLTIEMLGALNYLHKNGVVHRDLKLENYIFAGPGTVLFPL